MVCLIKITKLYTNFRKVMLLNPDRLAIFNYAHVPWLKKNMRKFDENTLPSPDVKLEILEFCEKF